MKITDIRITRPLGPENRNWVLMKVFTDEGIVGLGEWDNGASPDSFRRLKQALIGQDPMNINKLCRDCLGQMRGTGAGVEFALWDIKGKKLGVPMHVLLGGKIRDKIRIYCDCHAGVFWSIEEYMHGWLETRKTGRLEPIYEPKAYVEAAKRIVAEGFTALKFDADVANPWKMDTYDRSISRKEQEYIVNVLEKVRAAIGPYVDLAVDLHGSYNLTDALRICKDVEHLNLLWLEDPIPWEEGNVDALAKICAQTTTPICTGERFYGAQMYRELMVKQA